MAVTEEENRFSIINETHGDSNLKGLISESGVGENYVSSDGFSLPKSDIPHKDLKRLYKRDPIVHREVNKEIEDLFGKEPVVKTEKEELKKEIEELLFGDIGLYKLTKEASKGAYLDGMALIYLNYDGDEELGTEPDTIEEVKQAGVIYHKDVEDYNLEEDLSSEKFNEVTSWKVSVGAGQDLIHSSRLIHVIYDSIYGDPWGISKIAPEFDYHAFRQVIVESMVSTYYQNSSGIKAFSLPDKATKKEREYLENNIKQLREKAEIIIPNGTEISHPAPEIADSSKILEHLMETSTSMPFPLLTGVNAGAVTGSETNLRIYYIEIQKKRRRTINDMLVGKLKYLQQKGALPEGEFKLEWGDILPPDHEEEAGVLSKTALAVERLYEGGLVSVEEARDMLDEMTL